jgi:hypothetical protein
MIFLKQNTHNLSFWFVENRYIIIGFKQIRVWDTFKTRVIGIKQIRVWDTFKTRVIGFKQIRV